MSEKITALVLAAGQGKRMKSTIQKQFMELSGKPILYYPLRCFEECGIVDQIIVVTGADDIAYVQKEIIQTYHFHKVSSVIAGGAERYESVEHGLGAIKGNYADGIVLIHDGARPFVTEDMIRRSIGIAGKYGACTVGMPVKDTIKVVDADGNGIETPDRKTLWQIQTPQTFRVPLIRQAHEAMLASGNHNVTDDTMLIEQYTGQSVKVIEGSYENLKITTPEDLILAEAFLSSMSR
ncbi:MAG: 2-C-methyl-D-erythritol 4-phosphate cytidylyltransferase [Lachnospiraceae bacterium]|nr:2-C-methyl-D-erythritol 4-phosphate cytidylyltransferase [Lachnospiraceae bacterium]